jgi:hypothetical protein
MFSIQAHVAFNTDLSLNLHVHTHIQCNLYYSHKNEEVWIYEFTSSFAVVLSKQRHTS